MRGSRGKSVRETGEEETKGKRERRDSLGFFLYCLQTLRTLCSALFQFVTLSARCLLATMLCCILLLICCTLCRSTRTRIGWVCQSKCEGNGKEQGRMRRQTTEQQRRKEDGGGCACWRLSFFFFLFFCVNLQFGYCVQCHSQRAHWGDRTDDRTSHTSLRPPFHRLSRSNRATTATTGKQSIFWVAFCVLSSSQ